MLAGLAESLGWTKYQVKPGNALYDMHAMSAEETVALIRSKLKLRGGLRGRRQEGAFGAEAATRVFPEFAAR